MAFRITYTDQFRESLDRLTAQEKKQVKKKLALLCQDPNYPSLRVKRLQGTEKFYECSINMDIRVIWYYEKEIVIVAVDVGHHDILRKY